jgi:small-conductance mechanosensitive channel
MKEEILNFIFNPLVQRFAIIFISIVVIWLIIKVLQRNFFNQIKENNNHYRAKKISNFIGYLLTISIILIVFSDKLGGFTIALGVMGAGIAFAMQEIIVSFAGWIAIMLGGFYKSGDRVQLGGIKGDVMDIGLLRTTIMEIGEWVDGDLYNGRIVLIANSFVFKQPVFNYSGEFPFLWDEIKIPIQYNSNYDLAQQIFEQAGREIVGELSHESLAQWKILQNKYRLEEAQTEPMVSIIANDNWVEYTLRYIVDYKKRRVTKTQLFSNILKKVDASNGQIKFASATFQLVEAPDLTIKINPNSNNNSI